MEIVVETCLQCCANSIEFDLPIYVISWEWKFSCVVKCCGNKHKEKEKEKGIYKIFESIGKDSVARCQVDVLKVSISLVVFYVFGSTTIFFTTIYICHGIVNKTKIAIIPKTNGKTEEEEESRRKKQNSHIWIQ